MAPVTRSQAMKASVRFGVDTASTGKKPGTFKRVQIDQMANFQELEFAQGQGAICNIYLDKVIEWKRQQMMKKRRPMREAFRCTCGLKFESAALQMIHLRVYASVEGEHHFDV